MEENMQQISVPLGSETLTIEWGKLAKQAAGAAYVRYGDSVVLATACTAEPREGIDFFPLTVDYREYNYAAGKIPEAFLSEKDDPLKRKFSPAGSLIVRCGLYFRKVIRTRRRRLPIGSE